MVREEHPIKETGLSRVGQSRLTLYLSWIVKVGLSII